MKNKIKSTNRNATLSTSDIGEEVEHGKSFLKGGTFTALWIAVVNNEDAEIMSDQKHG